PQHEGTGARRILARPSGGAGAKTNLGLWETIAGLVSLFSACSLQGAACRAVGAPVRRNPASRAAPWIFRGAAQRTACSVTSLATRVFGARGAVTACRPNESQGPP